MHIQEFQRLMHQIYFHRDSERGAANTYAWLVDEIAELGEALNSSEKKALENEFADVIAWLASLANIVDVDLEQAAINKYNYKCPKCGRVPCECTF